MTQTIRRGYKHGEPFDCGFLGVVSIHNIHYKQYGNKDGKPGKLSEIFRYAKIELIPTVVFLHGGPGGSTSS
jgi:pimeloyl-ACP methyl ester carboxylesterase